MASPRIIAQQRADAMVAFRSEVGAIAAALDIPLPKEPDVRAKNPAHRSVQELQTLLGFVRNVRLKVAPGNELPGVDQGTVTPEGDDDHGEGEDLDALTVKQLKARAKAAGVDGFHQMHKAELIEALQSK